MATTSNGDLFHVPIFGIEAQGLIACNQRLQELGIQDTIQLPRLVVIGDQSTGKSSLIEAISNITLPKAAGLCTKCPIAINLTSGGSPTAAWRCTAYVENHFFYDTDGSKRARVNKASPMGPWKVYSDVKAPTKLKTIYDKDELADLIDLAQRHVLDPTRTFEPHSMNLAAGDRLEKFSPNPIRLDISVGDCPNLSFVDLPGVIQTAGQGQPKYLVELVENLARQHAKDENNVILLTLPINHDVSNSKSYSIMQSEHAQSRTMAVFTKVDIARQEERDQCIQKYFTNDGDHEFEHGHHLVMLAESSTTTGSMGRPDEVRFFSQEPWISLQEDVRARLGTHNLVHLLRKILFQKTAETLPVSLDSIRMRLDDVSSELNSMPVPLNMDELPYQLGGQLYEFQNLAVQLFTSLETASEGRNELFKLMEEFHARITKDKPTMIVKAKAEASDMSDALSTVDDDSEAKLSRTVKPSPTSTAPYDQRVQRFSLEEIRELNKKHYQASIPGQIEPRAVDVMNTMSVQFWDKTLNTFMHKVSRLVNQEVIKCIDAVFGQQKHLQLYHNIVKTTKDYLNDTISQHWSAAERRYDTEKATPFTFNQAALLAVETEVLDTRRTKRKQFRLHLAQTMQKAANAGSKRQPKMIDEKDLGPDPWDLEVQMSAKSRAYYDVAAHRFIDTICQEILCILVPACRQKLVDHVKHHLGLDNLLANREQIAIMMAEDPEQEILRARLVDERNRLTEGRTYINQILGFSAEPHQSNSTTDGRGTTSFDLPGNDTKIPPTPGKRKFSGSDIVTPSSKRSRNGTVVADAESPTPLPSRRTHLPVRLQSASPEEEMEEEK